MPTAAAYIYAAFESSLSNIIHNLIFIILTIHKYKSLLSVVPLSPVHTSTPYTAQGTAQLTQFQQSFVEKAFLVLLFFKQSVCCVTFLFKFESNGKSGVKSRWKSAHFTEFELKNRICFSKFQVETKRCYTSALRSQQTDKPDRDHEEGFECVSGRIRRTIRVHD